MATRIHTIAKELGIKSQAIIDKCIAEGIPAETVKNHMAVLSKGLEITIREWFSSAPTGSAVETTAHVDISTVRAAPRKSSRAKAKPAAENAGSDDGESVGQTGIAVAEPPASADESNTSTTTARPAAPRKPSGPRLVPTPGAEPTPEHEPDTVHPVAPATRAPARHAEPRPVAPPATPATPAPTETPSHGKPSDGGAAAPAAPHRPAAHVKPAPMNVPARPKVVTPAGPKLETRQAVRLSGPKVVRIETPDIIDRPRPRRDAGDAAARGPGGRGVTGGGEDDRGRGPTAAKRRPGAPEARTGVPARRRGVSGDDKGMHSGLWRPQDLAEREARLSRATGFLKQRRQQQRKLAGSTTGERATTAAESGGVVKIAEPFTIKDLSAATGVKVSDIQKKLMMQHNIMATANSGIDAAKAQEIMADYDIELQVEETKSAEQAVSEKFTGREMVDQRARGPIVTILGHVDHGKTSLLDRIRNANVAAGEAGGITQATSAFRVPLKISGEEKHVIFLDTPGHEAFTAMRARGAAITDVVVLVVSAPEGVMPQTIESINHAKAAKVPIVVALNKIDRPDATEARINQTLGELAKEGLNPVEWGGDIEVVRTSATKGTGIDKLLEILDLQGQMLELKADFGGPARGSVVESRREEGRGPVANVIVQDGQLEVGDFIVIGRAFGKVRDIVDDRGQRHKKVGPATVVQVSGFDELPNAGDKFYIVDSLREAQEAAEQRRLRERDAQLAQPKVTLDSLLSQMKDTDLKEILIVLKADVQGSVDVLKHEIERVKTDEVKARVLHAAVGGITESDVLLADASRAVIIGFNVIASNKARQLAEQKSVEIRTYQVIYEITDDIKKAAEGLLAPERRTQILGHADVRRVFKISKVGAVAGCFVTDGVIERDALIRVTRNGVVIENDRKLEQLKRVKDDAKEVRAGLECGMKIVGYDDIKEGDVLECYKNVEVKRTL
ncbi:MAG: translation initiation factor IF-2 [Phycisphaerales bacterium]|nr:translation initiation factor IF-2 [Phycisphaerales bacterium]